MNKDRDISLENILLDHELKKRREGSATERKAAPAEKPVTKAAPDEQSVRSSAPTPPKSAVDIFRAPKKAHEDDVKIVPPAMPRETAVRETPVKPTVKTVPPKPEKVVPMRAEPEEGVKTFGEREIASQVQKKKEEDTRRIPSVRPPVKEEVSRTVEVSMRTRLLTVPQEETDPLYDTHELDGQLEGQLVMEHFIDDPAEEQKLEEELLRRRREKAKGFRIIEGGKAPEANEKQSFKLVGEEEESDPEEETFPEEEAVPEEELEDFNEYAEADAIQSELAYRRRTGAVGIGVTIGMEAALCLLTAWFYLQGTAFLSPAVTVAVHAALLIGMLCINHRMVAGGLKGLLRFRADADTPPAVSGVIGLLYTVMQFMWLGDVADGKAYFLSAAAGMCVLAGAVGRQLQIARIRRNFGFVGNEKQKKNAATLLDDGKVAESFGYTEEETGLPRIVYYRRVSFLTNFLENSYAADPADRVMRWFTPIVLGVALLCSVGQLILSHGQWENAVVLFASSVMMSMPVWSMAAVQRTLSRVCKKCLRKGAMISGFAAAEQFGDHPRAVILEAADLFPKEQVKLHGIKTFSGTRIDEAITDAAAVVIAAKGPLSAIFHRLIENRTDILREVDSLAYEQDMGLSGWVGGRRVLIGNRRLLENHGVEVPAKEYELRYLRDGRSIVYLSTGGELSAMFVVSYLANDTIKSLLHALEREHVRITVRTCDANITEALMCEVMELPVRSVEVLSASEGRVYETLLADSKAERASALIACGGHAVSKITSVVQSCRLRRGAWAALYSQLIISVLMMAVCLFYCTVTGRCLQAELLPAVVAVSGVIGWLVGRLFRT